MKKALNFAVVGGDERQIFAAKRLCERGHKAELFMQANGKPYAALKETQADVYLLPIPLTRDGKTIFAPKSEEKIEISSFLQDVPQEALLFAGGTADFSDARLIDYAKNEDFALYNAIPTAEGALLLALQNLGRTVCGEQTAIIGFGKVGRETARIFHAVGACVTVFARRKEIREEARLLGYETADISELSARAGNYGLWLNTVPARIFDDSVLSAVPKNALLLELASAPYGFDLGEARAFGLHAILAGGLPGRFFPETAGVAVADTGLNIIKKGEYV